MTGSALTLALIPGSEATSARLRIRWAGPLGSEATSALLSHSLGWTPGVGGNECAPGAFVGLDPEGPRPFVRNRV